MTPAQRHQRTAWLEQAREAKSDDDLLRAIVAAWRAAPHQALVELATAAGARIARKSQAKHEDWLAVADRKDDADLGMLLDSVQVARVDPAVERAERLAAWPDDPRIAPAILRMLPQTSMRGRTTRRFWTIMFRILHRRFHVGVAAAVQSIDGRVGGDFGDYVDAKLKSIRRRLETARSEPVLDEPTAALVAALRVRLEIDAETRAAKAERAKSYDEWLREVWAAPTDDGVREVFADWLVAHGDPRGEFIMLQLTRKRRGLDAASQRRETVLLREHARTWMGPLEPAIDKKQFRFEGGFLWAAKLDARNMSSNLMTHPAWSTVREYTLDSAYERYCDPWLDHMIAFGAKRR